LVHSFEIRVRVGRLQASSSLLADRRHFADLDMARLVDHQAKFMAQVMGGPDEAIELGVTRRWERSKIGQ
jgi:hypothetical protein